MNPPTAIEREAIDLRWHHLHPEASPDAKPTDEESAALLAEIRDRQEKIEQAALDILRQASHNQPSRSGSNSKYMQLFWFIFMPVLLGIALLIYLGQLLAEWFQRR